MDVDQINSMDNLEILKVLDKKDTNKGCIILGISRWFENKPVLEKRSFYLDNNGKVKCGKSMGLKLEDLELLRGSLDDSLLFLLK